MRARTWLGGTLGLLAVGATAAVLDGRYPAGWWALLGPALALFAIGTLATSWSLLWALPLPAVAVVLGASVGPATDPVGAFIAVVLATLAAVVLWPLGVLLARRLPSRPVGVVAGTLLVGALAVPAVAVAERHRTVRADRPAPLELDERAGSFRGVALGDRLAVVRQRLGRGLRRPGEDTSLQPDVLTGPSSLEPQGQALQYGRDLLVVFDRHDRVAQLWTTDPRAQLRTGLGVGDSTELFRAAYGPRACTEGGIGSDWPIPYPECDVALDEVAGRWLYVGGTYEEPGAPAALLVLSRTDLYSTDDGA